MTQQSFLEINGPWCGQDRVDGNKIVRWLGGERYLHVWSFDTPEEAKAAIVQWKIDTRKQQAEQIPQAKTASEQNAEDLVEAVMVALEFLLHDMGGNANHQERRRVADMLQLTLDGVVANIAQA